ncbi:MAG: S41 family peptidase, partial [Alistipes sp.]
MNRKIVKYIALATFVGTALLFTYAKRNDFGLGRNMEIAVNMMRELSLNFVDEVDADKLMEGAAEGMVRNLDPYTQYMSEAEMTDFDVLTTGKYGGVGSLIRKRGDYVVLAQPYKGSPADKAGLKIGDKIVAIDGVSAKGYEVAEASKRMKGTPGTTLQLTVEHLLGGTTETVTLQRERIAIPGIPYAGYVTEGVGYIQHSDFTEGCYEDMRTAIEQLRASGQLQGLILDYRSNGGGILQEAVKILSMFVPKGTEVVTTKGRIENKSFRTSSEPILPNLPLIVLVNGNTASAAEIVAGALQDLDRAVVIGQKSFGKGLVQSTRPLGYNAFLKLTTAKYYIPSGRCIQAIDYSHAQDGTVKIVPDSLISEFTTKGGRKVYNSGGIMPDLRTEPEYSSRFAMTLYVMGFLDDFGDRYMQAHPTQTVNSRTFALTDADYADFERFMQDKKVDYESDTRRAL